MRVGLCDANGAVFAILRVILPTLVVTDSSAPHNTTYTCICSNNQSNVLHLGQPQKLIPSESFEFYSSNGNELRKCQR